MNNILKIGIISIIWSSTLFAGNYKVDENHSNIGFKVKHMMISNIVGKFDKFNGTFEYDEKTNSLKSLNGNVDVNSINTENEKRDEHLKSEDFFAANKFNNIKFDLTKVVENKVYGKLTIKDVTKDVKFDIETSKGTIKDPYGNIRVGLSLNGEINRFDYGLKYNSILENGGVAVGEKVKISVELEGILQK